MSNSNPPLSNETLSPLADEQQFAAIDLGSNSFHLIVARMGADGHLHVVDRLKEMVRLGSGLNEHNQLDQASQTRALACLSRFAERIQHLPATHVAVVGTNTLRKAQNAAPFLQQAEAILGHRIAVVAGREEARLIYLGVSHTLAKQDDMQRLVIDIGGGSTELIIGKHFEPLHLESLSMGCVSMSRFFYVDDNPEQQAFSANRWQQANLAAHLELRPIKQYYRNLGWDHATGSSGTIKAIAKVIRALQLAPSGIHLDDLYTIREKVITAKTLDKLDLPDLSDDRRSVFAGGLSVLIAVFEALNISQMQASDGALREGLIHELYGRSQQKDIRGQTVKGLQHRFQISQSHANRIGERALILFDHVAEAWQLDKTHRQLLDWSAQLHEIGLSIAHSGYHKHGAYILQEADLAGFSRQEQNWMSVLVRNHRRKIVAKSLQEQLGEEQQSTAIYLLILLRLAVLLHRSRKDEVAEIAVINAQEHTLCLYFAADELINRPLLQADLAQEHRYLQKLDVRLHVTSIATRDI